MKSAGKCPKCGGCEKVLKADLWTDPEIIDIDYRCLSCGAEYRRDYQVVTEHLWNPNLNSFRSIRRDQ